MPLRPLRTVHVSTREALDAALRSADRVVVEGDDSLLSYAVKKIAGDTEHQVDIELDPPMPSPAAPSFNAPLHAFLAPAAPIPSGFENDFAAMPAPLAESEVHARRVRLPSWIIVVAILLIAGVSLGVFMLRSHPVGETADAGNPASQVAPAPPPPDVDLGLPTSTQPPAPSLTNEAGIINAIAWPAVAVIAILALALIARQAIAAGRNVEFSWKVTEKVSGRVVITRVKNPRSATPA